MLLKPHNAFLFPGQGAQYPTMGRDFYEAFPLAKQTFEEADDLLKNTFSRLIFEGSAAELTLTKNSQVALFIVSTAILRVVKEQFPSLTPRVCAGLSLGEYTALLASEKISFASCLQLVRLRAEAMHEACETTQGTMYVVLGLSEEEVSQVLHSLPQPTLWIANLNCPEQVVISGAQESMPLAIQALKDKGAKRTLPLNVSGAFHSGLMRSAQEKLSSAIEEVPLKNSDIDLVMNVPGAVVKDANEIRRYLFEQVVSPVRWQRGIEAMKDYPIDAYFEMGPGKTLSSMNKRIGVTGVTHSIEKVSDLELIANYLEVSYAIAEC